MGTQAENGGAWRAVAMILFGFAELFIAFTSGYFERSMYVAYSEPSPLSQALATGRAALTQVAIIALGYAILRVRETEAPSAGRAWTIVLLRMTTFLFAGMAVWFMRETALGYRQQALLQVAQSMPVVLPGGIVLSGQEIDPWMIALFPAVQVLLAQIKPYILAKSRQLTADEIIERGKSQVAQAKVSAELMKARFGMIGGAGKALVDSARGKVEEPVLPEMSEPEPVADAEQGAQLAPAKAVPAPQLTSLLANGQWTYANLMNHVTQLGGSIGVDEATDAMKALSRTRDNPTGNRADGENGRPYSRGKPYYATAAKVKRWAQSYLAGKTTPTATSDRSIDTDPELDVAAEG